MSENVQRISEARIAAVVKGFQAATGKMATSVEVARDGKIVVHASGAKPKAEPEEW